MTLWAGSGGRSSLLLPVRLSGRRKIFSMLKKWFVTVSLITTWAVLSAPCRAAVPDPYANWWLRNSLSFKPMPRRWLFHAEGSLGFASMSGNTHGQTYDLGTLVFVRRSRWTNALSIEYGKQDVTYGISGGAINTERRSIKNHLRYDVTLPFYLGLGIENFRDTTFFIDNRMSYFLGAGYSFAPFRGQTFAIFLGGGFDEILYNRAAVKKVNEATHAGLDANQSSPGALVQMMWLVPLTKKTSVKLTGDYLKYTEEALGHRGDLGLELTTAITGRVSLSVGYQWKDEASSVIKAIGAKRQDTRVSTSVKFSL